MMSAAFLRPWVLAFISVYLVACFDYDTNTSGLGSAVQANNNLLASCAQVGPLSCEAPPFKYLAIGACAHLRSCLDARMIRDQRSLSVVHCDAPVLSSAGELYMTATMDARLDVDGSPSHGAYLFVRIEEDWCAADQLLGPVWNHGGYCETQFRRLWDGRPADTEAIFSVVSERICHMPLDQEEIAAGESDIAWSECGKIQYRLIGKALKKLSESDSEGPCKAH